MIKPLGIPPDITDFFAPTDVKKRWSVIKRKIKNPKLKIKFTIVKDFKK